MNSETLERLVIDRGLGELAPDAEELLVAYLDGHAEAARSVEEIGDVVETARAAVRIDPTAEQQPLPVPRFIAEASSGRRRPWAAWTKPVAAAAAIGLAFWLGSLGGRTDGPPRSALPSNMEVTLVPRTADSPSGGFWSLAELSRRGATPREAARPAIIWPGPVSQPRLGGQS